MPELDPSLSQGGEHAFAVSERVRLMRDGMFTNSGAIVSALVGLLLVPFMLRGLGPESYGLWLAALTLANIIAVVDFGLGWSVTREVAAAWGDESRTQSARFVRAAGNFYAILGLVGAVLLGTLGAPLSQGLHLVGESKSIALSVFGLVGVAFVGEQVQAFARAVFWGLRRFDVANLISVSGLVLRAVGIVVLLELGGGLLAVTIWQVAVAFVMASAALGILASTAPAFRFRVERVDWSAVRAQVSFGVMSQLATAAAMISWEAAPLVIGLVLGSGAIVPYYIGQKVPFAVGSTILRAGQVLLPAASQHQSSANLARTREVLEAGTRWMVALALPLCLVLWILAPSLLLAWLGEAPQDTVLVLRLVTAAVLVDALGVGALHLVWGRGAARTILLVQVLVALATLTLTALLLPLLGIAGAACALLVGVTLGSLAFVHLGSRECGVRELALLCATARGLLAPVALSLALTWSIVFFARPESWLGVAAAALAGWGAYAVSLYVGGARPEERLFAQEILTLAVAAARVVHRALRRARRRGVSVSGNGALPTRRR